MENLELEHDFGTDWLKRVNTGYISREVRFGSPIIKQMFRRNYMQSNRDIFFLSVFAEFQIKDQEKVRQIQEILANSLKKAIRTLENQTKQLQVIIKDAAVDSSITYTQVIKAKAPVISPTSNRMLDLFILADNLHGLLMACWYAGEVPTEEKRKGEEEIKRTIRVFRKTVSTMMGTTLSYMKKQRQLGTLAPEVEETLAEADAHVEETNREALEEGESVEADPTAVREAEKALVTTDHAVAAEGAAVESVPA
ncbi:hypothetical protein QU487_06170 [Crenobacter sp. SG2305]|uniref:hypothetical protein n=1 Tax=Crenobacter oryzisoli TaxID=3056844 RepID=UPI0025AB1CB7|nr:hypothetical protein [Crenobacter sp. SG2305]MDN0082337.1 hypothetical protein [Crenobacter sp. SG2305]